MTHIPIFAVSHDAPSQNIIVRSTYLMWFHCSCVYTPFPLPWRPPMMDNVPCTALICRCICFATTSYLFSTNLTTLHSCLTLNNNSTSLPLQAKTFLVLLFGILIVFSATKQSITESIICFLCTSAHACPVCMKGHVIYTLRHISMDRDEF